MKVNSDCFLIKWTLNGIEVEDAFHQMSYSSSINPCSVICVKFHVWQTVNLFRNCSIRYSDIRRSVGCEFILGELKHKAQYIFAFSTILNVISISPYWDVLIFPSDCTLSVLCNLYNNTVNIFVIKRFVLFTCTKACLVMSSYQVLELFLYYQKANKQIALLM